MPIKYPNKDFRKLVKFINDGREDKTRKIYEDKEPREINWNAYTISQINEAKEILLFIKKEVDKCEMPLKKVGRPLTNPKVLAKAILICEALGFTERKAQGWLELLGPFAGIYEKLDDRVIGNAYNKPEVAYIFKQIFDRNKNSDGKLMGDGSGLETSRKQNYGLSRKSTKEFLTSIVDSREIVQAFDFSGEDECKAMHSLIEEVEGESLRLDAGFNDRELVRKILENGMLPYVYPYKSNNINGNEAWKEMYLEFFTDVIAWLTEYYQRVHCESFHSAFKRVFGLLSKIRVHSKFVQVSARIILHNQARLSYFKRIDG
jgi:transposase